MYHDRQKWVEKDSPYCSQASERGRLKSKSNSNCSLQDSADEVTWPWTCYRSQACRTARRACCRWWTVAAPSRARRPDDWCSSECHELATGSPSTSACPSCHLQRIHRMQSLADWHFKSPLHFTDSLVQKLTRRAFVKHLQSTAVCEV